MSSRVLPTFSSTRVWILCLILRSLRKIPHVTWYRIQSLIFMESRVEISQHHLPVGKAGYGSWCLHLLCAVFVMSCRSGYLFSLEATEIYASVLACFLLQNSLTTSRSKGFVWLCYTTKCICLWMSPLSMDWALLHQLTIKNLPLQTCPKANLI